MFSPHLTTYGATQAWGLRVTGRAAFQLALARARAAGGAGGVNACERRVGRAWPLGGEVAAAAANHCHHNNNFG